MDSRLPIRELASFQELVAAHTNLQPVVEGMARDNSLVDRINNHSNADIATMADSADALRSVCRISNALQNERLSQEAIEVINTEGAILVNNLNIIFSRTVIEVRENTRALLEAVAENERTRIDPVINELIQQQIEITRNISADPRQAYEQIQQVNEIGDRLNIQIETVEPNENANVRRVADYNSKYSRYAVRVLFVSAAVVGMCASVAYLAPIVISTIAAASTGVAGTVALQIGGRLVASAALGAATNKK
ncbi:unnamed protein product [Adineta steineri]|nr:unnamed protein product [Adineta steineri]CAF4053825.1 unnamed protein product [Adineta steineri]CAF4156235.1 unnamed protein product [Adineta steineri]